MRICISSHDEIALRFRLQLARSAEKSMTAGGLPFLFAAAFAASAGCGSASSTGSTDAPKNGSSSKDQANGDGPMDARGDNLMGDTGDDASSPATGGSGFSDAATEGTYDGPVANGACPKLPASGTWQNVSPPGSNYTKTYTGMVSVVVRPDNPAVVYAGADSNGIFKSTDCGATWALVSTGANAASLKSGRPWSLVIDPVVPDTMYVVEGYGASGLWKSTNAGVDWQQILTKNITSAFNDGGQITSISLDPTDHTHLVIESHQGADTAAGKCGTNTCIAESTDSGLTWTLLTIPTPWAEDTGVAVLNHTTWLYCSVYKDMWYTQNEGMTWQKVALANGAVASCNWYQPYVWKTPGGQYLLPGTTQSSSGGVIESGAGGSVTSWTPIANSPQSIMMMATSSNLVAAGGETPGSAAYWIASQSAPSVWKSLPGPKTGSPTSSTTTGGYSEFLAYDGVHHVLYSSTYATGLWQTIVE